MSNNFHVDGIEEKRALSRSFLKQIELNFISCNLNQYLAKGIYLL